jgi:DNA-binding NarL/FixJ family response regulator
LTQREREIANLAANGASNQLIADNCGISERTVKAHLSAVFTKLNVSDRLQLALRVHGIS